MVLYECLLAHVGRATWRDNGIPSAGEDDSHPTAAASVPSVVRASMPSHSPLPLTRGIFTVSQHLLTLFS